MNRMASQPAWFKLFTLSFCSYLRFSFQFLACAVGRMKVKHAYDHSILLFGTTPRALYTDLWSRPGHLISTLPRTTRGSQASLAPGHAFAAWTLWPARFACLSESKPWGLLMSQRFRAHSLLLCPALAHLTCIVRHVPLEHHLGIRRHGKQYHVQLEKAQDPFNKGFVNWCLELLVACRSLSYILETNMTKGLEAPALSKRLLARHSHACSRKNTHMNECVFIFKEKFYSFHHVLLRSWKLPNYTPLLEEVFLSNQGMPSHLIN